MALQKHEGVVAVEALPGQSSYAIAYDARRITENDLRRMAAHHAPAGARKRAMRLEGTGSEYAARRLEQRIRRIPGVRHATATYIGRVLCLTFEQEDEVEVLSKVREAGANIEPLKRTEKEHGLWNRVRSGELQEELFCGVGFLFLLAAAGSSWWPALAGSRQLLYAGAYVFCGWFGVRSAVASLREWTLDVDVLMVLAALGAAAIGAPFEGALLLFLFSFSNVLQRYAMNRTQRAIESLLALRPDTALLKVGRELKPVPVESLVPGDVVIVRPGDQMPIDGVVLEGCGSVNEASLTGESMPVDKQPGSAVYSGTLNQDGGLEIQVGKRAEDSILARMVKLVAEAQAEKSHTQRFLERAEQYYAGVVIGGTVLAVLLPWLVWDELFATAFYRAMTLMVVASPCALIISTPATVLSAIGGAARRGILIKGGSHLEVAARVDIVAFDKTGTLTRGKPALISVMTPDGESAAGSLSAQAARALALCAALEHRSEHPLAAAIVQAAAHAGLVLPQATAFQAAAGKGAEAMVDGQRYVAGSDRFLRELGVQMDVDLEAFARGQQASGATCVWLGRRGEGSVEVIALFALADTLRTGVREVIDTLHAAGVKKIVMLTGDSDVVAQAIGREAGVDEIAAELLPEDKVRAIRELKSEGTVLMVGDGINDAPALASAHLGLAMGAAGTDIAMETADVVLMGDKLENIPLLLMMAQRARRILIQNLLFAGGVIVVLVGATLGMELPLPIGVIGHEGSTVLVCLNGLRLLGFGGSFRIKRK